jgi:hypothetical protein
LGLDGVLMKVDLLFWLLPVFGSIFLLNGAIHPGKAALIFLAGPAYHLLSAWNHARQS